MFKNKKGFTLIELIAVVIILAILMMIAIPSITSVIEDSRKKGTISSLQAFVNKARTDISLGLDEIEKYSFFNGDNKPVIEQNPNHLYFIPWACLDVQKGEKSGYGAWTEETGVFVKFREDRDPLYLVQFKDTTLHSLPMVTDAELDKNTAQLRQKIKTNNKIPKPLKDVVTYEGKSYSVVARNLIIAKNPDGTACVRK